MRASCPGLPRSLPLGVVRYQSSARGSIFPRVGSSHRCVLLSCQHPVDHSTSSARVRVDPPHLHVQPEELENNLDVGTVQRLQN